MVISVVDCGDRPRIRSEGHRTWGRTSYLAARVPRRLCRCDSFPRQTLPASFSPVRASTCTALPRLRRCSSRHWSIAPRSCATSASSTSTRRDPGHTWRPRWRATSGIAHCSSGRTPGPPSTKGAPTTSRSSCPTCRASSRAGALPLDVVFVNATPPDAHGFCSLGTSVEAMHAAIRAAKTVVVQLNRSMPRTLGDSFIHVDDIDLGGRGRRPAVRARQPGHRRPRGADRRARGRPRAGSGDAAAGDRRDPGSDGAWP